MRIVVIIERCLFATFCLLLTLWRLAAFGDFQKQTPKRMWLCVGISLVRYALQTR